MKELTREQVVLIALDAGFATNDIRNNIVKYEKLIRLIQSVMEKEDVE